LRRNPSPPLQTLRPEQLGFGEETLRLGCHRTVWSASNRYSNPMPPTGGENTIGVAFDFLKAACMLSTVTCGPARFTGVFDEGRGNERTRNDFVAALAAAATAAVGPSAQSPTEDSSAMNTMRRQMSVLGVLIVTAFAAPAALADIDYQYYHAYQSSGGGGGDLTNYYRYFNDACSGDGNAWTKAIYGLTDGSWVVAVESYGSCDFGGKAHLNPSGSYGYNQVQSKCRLTSGYTLLICDTSRP
jgi:hypothetical protein